MPHQRATTAPDRAGSPSGSAATADGLLAAYRPGDMFFASHRGALLGRGTAEVCTDPRELAPLLREAGAEGAVPLALGALPFAQDAPAHLVVPRTVHRAGPVATRAPAPARRPLAAPWTVRRRPEPAEHTRAVERAVRLLEQAAAPDAPEELRKVVLARALRLEGAGPVDTAALLHNLADRDPSAYTFALDLPPRGGARERTGPGHPYRTQVGASPELLVAKHGDTATANPLAGSARRSADPTRDQRAAVELLTSDKDRREHALVVEAVSESLSPLCADLDVPSEPELLATAAMWHLSTRITGRLRSPDTSSLELARAVHPTPAVCGSPTGRALQVIADLEGFDRGFFTGAVGHTDARGDGEWAVAIRCADVEGAALDLFAGGGIVVGSDPGAELAETSAKLRTLLYALGIDQDL